MHFSKCYLIFYLLLGSFVFVQAKNPPKTNQLRFSHKQHVINQEIECQTCHAMALKSESGRDNLLPAMETCADCHEVENKDSCSICHKNPKEIEALPRVQIYITKFSHKRHLATGIECTTCHPSIAQQKTVQHSALPPMKLCFACHQQKSITMTCQT